MAMRGVGLAAFVVSACTIELAPRPRPPAPPARDVVLGLSIASVTLHDGLRAVIVTDPTAAELQITMRYDTGAADDGATPGIAHLVEHLMFQQDLEGQPLYAHLEDVATYFNAGTTFDGTTYVARGPTSALDKLLAIEAVRLDQRCGNLTEQTFAREREVVIHELEQRDQATEIYGALYRALYPEGHPYRRAIGGTTESVRAITRDEACAFADAHYAPNNAVLVVSSPLPRRDVDAALAKLDARVAARSVAAPVRAIPPLARPGHLEIAASIDEDVLVVAWPLPSDAELAAKVRAIGAALPHLVDNEIKGQVVGVLLGDRGAPMLGVAVVPAEGETFKQVIEGTRRAVASLPKVFAESQADNLDEVLFDRIKQAAVYGIYSTLEDGGERDDRLASYVQAGRDPSDAMGRELRAVGELSRDEAEEIAAKFLGANTPTVVTLKAAASKRRGDKISIHSPIHDLGRRRTPIDPARATRPASETPAPATAGVTTRVLPNGLKVVLMPVTSVPTFDARLIFAAGTADEPAGERGVALLAAHTLTFDLHHLPDALAFVRAGGMRNVDVASDRTTFAVQGLDSELDIVLAGLRRWVRDGVYDNTAEKFISELHREAKRVDDQGPLTDAWRTALFGADHPYVAGGLPRLANQAITLDEATRFRAAHYSPDDATLVIAGRFDPAAADRWIDFLFSDWGGHATPRKLPPAAPKAAVIAKADDTALVQVRIAIPVTANAREQHFVAAEMVNDIAHDVRYELAASYTLDAQLAETPAASYIVVAGWVDAARAAAAIQLIHDRIEELRRDPNAAARAFVIARGHVITQLRSRVGAASALAERVERDVELGRDPLSDLRMSTAVQALTIADMSATLAELNLASATVLMDGPESDVSGAAKVLGKKPAFLRATAVAAPAVAPTPSFQASEQRVYRSQVEDSLTAQPLPRLMLAVAVQAGLGIVSGTSDAYTGYTLTAEAGYRYGWTNALGARIDVGRLSLDTTDASGLPTTQTLKPVDVLALWHLGGTQRAWSEVAFGLHFEQLSGMAGWRSAPMYGVHIGVDLLRLGPHRVAVSARYEGTTHSSFDYSALSIGLAYRH